MARWWPFGKAESKPDTGPPVWTGGTSSTWRDIQRFDRWRQMRNDPQIALGLMAVKSPVIAADWSIECPPRDESPQASALAEAIQDWLTAEVDRLWWAVTPKALLGAEFGRMGAEKVFAVLDDAKYHLVEVRDLEPDAFDILVDDARRFAGLRLRRGKGDLDWTKSILFTHNSEFGNLHGRSIYKRVEDPWWWCKELYDVANRYMERKGDPPIKARAPSGTRRDANGAEYSPQKKLADAIDAQKKGGKIVLGSEKDKDGNFEYDIEYFLDDKRLDQMLEYIQHLETLKLRGMLVPERVLTQDTSTGSYGMAQVHAEAFIVGEEMILSDVVGMWNSQIIPQLVVANWGTSAPEARLVTRPLSDEVQQLVRQIFQGLASSAPQVFTAIIDLITMCESLEIPLTEGARERLEKLQQQAALAPATNFPAFGGFGASPSAQLKDPSTPLGDDADAVHDRAMTEAIAFFENLKARLAQSAREGARDPFRS